MSPEKLARRMDAKGKYVHTSRIAIRWGDMDAFAHVNNVHYFRYMEQTRVEFFEKLGFLAGKNASLVIVNAGCTYLKPFTYPGTVEVRMYAAEPGRSSMETRYDLVLQGADELYATGQAKVVWIDQASGRSAPIPEELRRAMDKLPEGGTQPQS
jgi:acyl-CoA thioester hydrolase